jgi:bifunctional UDP-N-acetylglucosamine pyrophosphorylase/glucosamine-1-phosphate N-acetyltransferase
MNDMTVLDVVIMAAGKGTRMKSSMPKVLHRLAGKALVQHVIDTARSLQARHTIVITGHGAEQVEAALHQANPQAGLQFARQMPQLGTGHAVQQTVPLLADDAVVVVLSGDVPLTQADTLQALVNACAGRHLALLTIAFDDPTGYGRIVRNADGHVQAIVEHKDASDAQRAIREVYSGIMAVPAKLLKPWLARLDNHNAQQEYYLTDVVKFAVADGVSVVGHQIADPAQVAGVNSPTQLAELERAFQLRQAQALMAEGVRIIDPARFDVRGSLQCAQDVEIDVNCIFQGQVSLGQGVKIGANCVIANCTIAAGAVIHPFTHIDGEQLGVSVGEGALIGPFARLRPGAQLAAEVHIGNFVEVKNATLARGAKANHLAYLGDATVGERVNFGAGSIINTIANH